MLIYENVIAFVLLELSSARDNMFFEFVVFRFLNGRVTMYNIDPNWEKYHILYYIIILYIIVGTPVLVLIIIF